MAWNYCEPGKHPIGLLEDLFIKLGILYKLAVPYSIHLGKHSYCWVEGISKRKNLGVSEISREITSSLSTAL